MSKFLLPVLVGSSVGGYTYLISRDQIFSPILAVAAGFCAMKIDNDIKKRKKKLNSTDEIIFDFSTYLLVGGICLLALPTLVLMPLIIKT
jgi:hypothetical protein